MKAMHKSRPASPEKSLDEFHNIIGVQLVTRFTEGKGAKKKKILPKKN